MAVDCTCGRRMHAGTGRPRALAPLRRAAHPRGPPPPPPPQHTLHRPVAQQMRAQLHPQYRLGVAEAFAARPGGSGNAGMKQPSGWEYFKKVSAHACAHCVCVCVCVHAMHRAMVSAGGLAGVEGCCCCAPADSARLTSATTRATQAKLKHPYAISLVRVRAWVRNCDVSCRMCVCVWCVVW
jgi:hypothetical protein